MTQQFHYNGLMHPEDLCAALEELQAYYALDGLPFDFGDGPVPNELSYGAEFVDYRQDMRFLESLLKNVRAPSSRRSKSREHKYVRNRAHKDRLHALAGGRRSRFGYYPVYFNGRYAQRTYRGKRSKFLKKQSSKKFRQSAFVETKGNKHKRVFDFWWELY